MTCQSGEILNNQPSEVTPSCGCKNVKGGRGCYSYQVAFIASHKILLTLRPQKHSAAAQQQQQQQQLPDILVITARIFACCACYCGCRGCWKIRFSTHLHCHILRNLLLQCMALGVASGREKQAKTRTSLVIKKKIKKNSIIVGFTNKRFFTLFALLFKLTECIVTELFLGRSLQNFGEQIIYNSKSASTT